MIVKVVGKKVGTFTDKETGQVVEYGKLHCVGKFDMSDSGAEGEMCMILSCKPKFLYEIPVPCNADIQFNQYGRLADVNVM